MQSSRKTFDFTVNEETGGKTLYERRYRKPTWPGASSGVTVGIGYDLGQTPTATIRADWTGRVPDEMLGHMLSASGVKGTKAKPLATKLKKYIDIPWATAIAVHADKVWPRWEKKVAAALPNFAKLPADCKGVLVSLTFNRGASYNSAGDRYREMRAIRAHMARGEFDQIPEEIRSMKRLWIGKGVDGLLARRDKEADIFEAAITAAPVSLLTDFSSRNRTADDPADASVVEDDELPPPDPKVLRVQEELRRLKYWTVGEPDGRMGSSTEDAILSFRKNNGLPLSVEIDDELLAALATAPPKPVTATRANATPKEVAKKNPSVLASMRTRLAAWWAAGLAGLGTIFDAVTGYFKDTWESMDWLRDIFASVPIWAWLALAAVIAGGLALNAGHAARKATDDYNEGKLT